MRPKRHTDLPLEYALSVPSNLGDDAVAPLVVIMHGRGADADDLADIAPLLDRGGYRFLFPNAPRPFEAYPGMTFGYSWFDGWPPVGDSLADSREQVLRFLEAAVAHYPAPPRGIVIAGFSQGGMMALDTGFRTGLAVAGIVCMSGALDENDLPPIGEHRDRPVLIVHGTADEVVKLNDARRTRHLLQEHGVDPEYHEFLMGHHVTPESLEVVGDFIARRLGD